MNCEYIVFACEHYNPLGLVRSLGENGIRPIGIIIKGDPKITSKSKFFKKVHEVDTIEQGYEVIISTYKGNKNKNFLFSSDDKIETFLDSHYDDLKDYFYFFNAGQANRVAYYMNKDNINTLAKKNGLSVLPTHVVNKGEIPEDLEYPIITKVLASTMGAWKNDVYICHNKEELVEAYEKIESPMLLLQKYIKKKNEYCMEGFSINHGKEMAITIVSNYNYLLEDQYSPFMTCKNFDRPDIAEGLKGMIKDIGFEGIFEIEFLIDENDNLYFLEINFRNSTWSYASTRAGMPLPVLWSKYMISNKIDMNCIKKIPKGFTAMVEPQDFKVRVSTKKVSKITWLRDLMCADCRYFLGRRDIRPFLHLLARKIRKN